MEVSLAGKSCMLANPTKLKKIAPKINKLAAREFEVGCPACSLRSGVPARLPAAALAGCEP